MKYNKFNILIVEDDEAHAQLTKRAIRKAGNDSRVDIVVNGEEALDYLFNRGRFVDQAEYPTPGLVLLDIKLPGINGIEVLKEAKKNPDLRKVPMIMLSTSDRREDIVVSYCNYANSYIKKPIGYKQFEEKILQMSLYWTNVSEHPVNRT